METCNRAETTRWGLPMHPKDLWCQGFRLLRNLLALSHRLLTKKLQKVGEVEQGTALGKSTELPQDVLMTIFATLDIPDLVRAGSVCSSWRSAYASLSSLGQCKEHTTPCLFYTTSECADDNVACLYSLAEQREYRLTLPYPPIRSRILIGSSNGWLVTVDEACEMLLVNPITGQQINLPSVATIEHVKPIYDDSGSIHKYSYLWHFETMVIHGSYTFTFAEFREWFYCRAFVFSDTSTEGYLVVLIHKPFRQISVARKGDDKWTWLPHHDCYENCFYKDGLLYAVTGEEMQVFDLSGPVATLKMIMKIKVAPLDGSSYIVKGPQGGLLHIHRSADYDIHYRTEAEPLASVWHTEKIEMYKIDVAEETVAKINCLNDHVLFLGHSQSLCLSAEEFPPLKANHAYFTDDIMASKMYRKNCRDICVIDLGNNDREELVSPQLWSNWPNPIWITPNVTKMKFGSNK